jgi:UDP-apiose/xylose synthase
MSSFGAVETVALFGGGGFIGSHLARRLVDRYDLEVVDVSAEKLAGTLDHSNLSFHRLDISDPANDEQCREVVERSDLVVDLIAYANPQQYVDMPLEVVDLNYHQNLKLVEACAETDTWLMQFSTCEVYGKVGSRTGDEVVFSEDTSDLVMGPVEKHRWIYASAKQLLERMVHAHGLQNGLEWTIVRPFNFVGPRMDYIVESPSEGTPRVFASFMSALLYDHPIRLVDGGRNRRSFTDIDDAVAGIETIVENRGQFRGEVVNVGTPSNETTIEDLAHLMCDVYEEQSPVGGRPAIESVPGEEYYGEGYADVERRVPDVEKLRAAGWRPDYDLRETLERTVSHYVSKYERPDAPVPRLSD